MASKNQVTLTFAGDSSKLETAFDKVGAASKTMADKVGESSSRVGTDTRDGFDKAGEGLDNTYDKFDALESIGRGTGDTISGVGEIMQGNVLQGATDLAGGVAALASGFSDFLIPIAKAGAVKVFAAAQWLLNAAMSANPIGLVVIAIVLLVAIFVIAWKKSETFRAIVTGAFSAVWEFVKKVGAWFKDTLWPWLKGVFDKIIGAVGAVKDWIVRKFGEAVDWLKGLPGKISSAVSTAWNGFRSGVTSARDWVATKFNQVVEFVKGLPKRISSAASGMWDGIKNAFKAALNWIIGKWNGLGFDIPSITAFGKTIGGGRISTPDIPYFHTGGIVPGGLGSETLALLKAGERVTAGTNTSPPPEVGPIYLEAHIDLGNDVTKVVQVEMRRSNRSLKRDVKAA